MSILVIILIWAAAVVTLAGRGMKRSWLASLFAFPLICAAAFALEPSFGSGGEEYREVATVVAVLVWTGVAIVSVIAWFIGARSRKTPR